MVPSFSKWYFPSSSSSQKCKIDSIIINLSHIRKDWYLQVSHCSGITLHFHISGYGYLAV
jgi:hypothetical protein